LARGVLYAQLDQYDKAAADFEKANELDPSQSLSIAAQGLAAMQKNDLDGLWRLCKPGWHKNRMTRASYIYKEIFLRQKGVTPGSPEFEKALQSTKKSGFTANRH